jgi:hypothetical protein
MVRLILLLWVVSSGLLLAACSNDLPTIPDYPNSQNVQTRVGEQTNWLDARHTTFQTNDSPDKVLAFYRAHLPELGWTDKGAGYNPSTIRFEYRPGCQLYTLDIEAVGMPGGRTVVHLYLFPYTC